MLALAAQDEVTKINHAFADLNWIVRIYRWENSRRGLGAAQTLINRDVDECDLLVGILHSRIGTPTEQFASGFEEEVERFRARRTNGEPVDAVLLLRDLREGERRQRGIRAFRQRMGEIAFCRSGYRAPGEGRRNPDEGFLGEPLMCIAR